MQGSRFIFYSLVSLLLGIAWGANAQVSDSLAPKAKTSRLVERGIVAAEPTVTEISKVRRDSLKPVDTQSNIVVLTPKVRKGPFAWRDSVVIAKRSAFYALTIPGFGQLNNRDYWKLPIVYAGLGVSVYFFADNTTKHNRARAEYAFRMDHPNEVSDQRFAAYTTTMLQGEKDYYKRMLDMTMLLTVAGYGLQIIEANAAAHLKGFDISDDISLQIKPKAIPSPLGLSPGIGFAFNFK